MLVELSVKHVVREPLASRYLMILQAPEDKQKRYIKICVGQPEGEAVECFLSEVTPPRPMTYDLICSIFSLFHDAKINKIIIDACEQDVFYAKMMISVCGEEKEIDCRPSDAVAIAVRLNVPIFVECCIIEKHGFICPNDMLVR